MITKTERLSRPGFGVLPIGNARSLGEAAVDMAKRFCMIRVLTAGRGWLGSGWRWGSFWQPEVRRAPIRSNDPVARSPIRLMYSRS